jgi:hypothetical protein
LLASGEAVQKQGRIRNEDGHLQHDQKATRQILRRAQKVAFKELKHVERIPLEGGRHHDWELCHPTLLLAEAVQRSALMQSLYAPVANAKRDEEWSLVVAFDEYVPGSKFQLETNRKSMNLSFNFSELGAAAMSHELTWHHDTQSILISSYTHSRLNSFFLIY